MRNLMTLSVQFRCQSAYTLARPPERGLRVSTRHRLDESFQIFIQTEIFADRLFAPPSDASDTPWTDAGFLLQLLDAQTDCLARESCRSRYEGDPSTPDGHRLRGCQQSSCPLIEFVGQSVKSLFDLFFTFIHASQFTTCCPSSPP